MQTKSPKKAIASAVWVGSGIFLSRISGLIRERVFAYFFGQSDAGDAFKLALRVPNFLQNLFGEGVLSASFIPAYAKLIGEGKEAEARRLAFAVLSFLFVLSSAFVLLGVLFAPYLIHLVAPGFPAEKKALTVQIVQILFPGTGVLVLSAWCLGILNSHRKFFLSYFAPVLWNLSFVVALLIWGSGEDSQKNAVIAGWSLFVGSFLQFLVQVPSVLKIFKKNVEWVHPFQSTEGIGVAKNLVPVALSRGVVQVSAYIDNIIASLLPMGAVSILAYAQTLYLLPISLFGMSITAAELPEFSKETSAAPEELRQKIQERLEKALMQVTFFVIPSMTAFLFLGESFVALLFQTGAFGAETTKTVALVLGASSFGLLANTQGRLFASVFYAVKDVKTPLRAAITRVVISSSLGAIFALVLPEKLGISENYAVGLLALAAGLVAWIEYVYLKLKLRQLHGVQVMTSEKTWLVLWTTLLFGALLSLLNQSWSFSQHLGLYWGNILLILLFGLLYLLICLGLKHPVLFQILRRFLR